MCNVPHQLWCYYSLHHRHPLKSWDRVTCDDKSTLDMIKIVHIVLVITKQWWDYRWYKYEACSTGYSKLCTWVSVTYSATCRDTKHKDWIYKSWVCHARLHSEDTKMASLGKIQSLNTPSCNPVYTKWGSKVVSVARPERLSTPWCKGIWWGN